MHADDPAGGRTAGGGRVAHGAGPALRIPALWLFGGVDKTVPTRLCVERLEPVAREPGRDFSYVVFPGGGHGLVETANGLLAEQARSDRFVPGLHTTIAEWLRARGVI